MRHRKVHQVVVEFGRLEDVREQLAVDHVFCALGTTMKKAGSRDKFREVDMDYPLKLARLCRSEGASHFSIVSALGASRSSPFFYSRVKGEVEAALQEMHWPSLAIFRPSVIAGDRGESRPFERVGEQLLKLAPATWRPVAGRGHCGGDGGRRGRVAAGRHDRRVTRHFPGSARRSLIGESRGRSHGPLADLAKWQSGQAQ